MVVVVVVVVVVVWKKKKDALSILCEKTFKKFKKSKKSDFRLRIFFVVHFYCFLCEKDERRSYLKEENAR